MMRKLFLTLSLISACAVARGQQYGLYQTCTFTNAIGQAINGAQVYFLTQPANTVTLTPKANVYSSSTGGALTQPILTNGFGSCTAYLSPGAYTVCFISPSTGKRCFADQSVTLGGASGTITGQTANAIPLATGPTSIGAPSHLSDNGSVISSTLPISVSGCTTGQVIKGDGTGCVSVGTGTVNASPQFSLFYQPSSGSSATAQGDPNVTTDGSGNVTGASLKAKAIGGSRYATQFGTSTTGIQACLSGATGLTCVADPTYGLTEQYSLSTLSALAPSNFQFTDLRNGIRTQFFNNWGYGQQNLAYAGQPANLIACSNNSPYTTNISSNTQQHDCSDVLLSDNTPGASFGQPGITGAPAGWYSFKSGRYDYTSWGKGIVAGLYLSGTRYGIGDFDGIAIDIFGNGGWRTPSDQGTIAGVFNTHEYAFTATGTCTTGCTTGSTSIKATMVGSVQGDRCCIIDTSNTPITGTITNIAASALGGGSTLTIAGATLPVSNAWGTLSGDCVAPQVFPPSYSSSVTCNVTVTSGTFTTGTSICFKGTYHECAKPTAVTNGAGPTASVTMPLRLSHKTGSEVMQGGMAGKGMEATAYTTGGIRYLFEAFGSTSSSSVEVGQWSPSGIQAVGLSPIIYQFFNLSTLSNGGTTTISGTYTAAGSTLFQPPSFAGATINIAGSTGGSLDGPCTNLTFSSGTAFTCVHAGLSGTLTSTTATATLNGRNAVQFWDEAEVLDVLNEASPASGVDGTMALEPNNIAFAASDNVEVTHELAAKYLSQEDELDAKNPFATFDPIIVTFSGAGAQGGNTSASSSNAGFFMQNNQPDSYYKGSGGTATPPNFANGSGPYNIAFDFGDHAPAYGQPFIYINPATWQLNDVNYNYNLWQINGKSGGNFIAQFTPNTNTMIINNTAGPLTFAAGGAGISLASTTTTTTQTAADNSTKLATTAFVKNQAYATLASPALTGTPTAPTPAATDNSTTLATTAFVRSLDLVAALTTTAATSDNVTVTGMTATGHCGLTATNASAATNIATTYVSAKTTNQITVTHTATASMTYDVMCTPY